MFEFEYIEDGEIEPPEEPEAEEMIEDDCSAYKCNPDPIVKQSMFELMRKMHALENQFFAKELLNKRNANFTSYDVCPKGSVLSKEHKVSIPGPFHGCHFNHLTAGGDYLTIPDLNSSSTAATEPKSSRLQTTKKNKTRPSCSKCSFICFGHQDASICYPTYLEQCTFAHLPPCGPKIDKPYQPPGQALKTALSNVKLQHIMNSDEIKYALLPGATISSNTPRNWLEELKDLVDPSKRHKLFESSHKLVKAKKSGLTTKMKRNLRLVKTPRPMPPISARLTKKSSNPTTTAVRVSSAVVVQKPESMAAVSKKLSAVKSRYMNEPTRITKPKKLTGLMGESGDGLKLKAVKTEINLAKPARARPLTSSSLPASKNKITKPKSKITLAAAAGDTGAVGRPKTSIENRISKTTNRPITTAIGKKLTTANNTGGNKSGLVRKRRKVKAKTSYQTSPGGSKELKPKVTNGTLTVKKKKVVKPKTVVHQAFGFEFEHSVAPIKRRTKKALTAEKYRDCILKMLEKGEKKVEGKPSVNLDNDAEGDDNGDGDMVKEVEAKKSAIKKPKFRRHRKLAPKKPPADDKEKPGKGPVTIVLYKSQAKRSKSTTVFPIPTTITDGPNKSSQAKEPEQENKAGFSGTPLTNWTKKNSLFLPIGVNVRLSPQANLPVPHQRESASTKAREDELQSLITSKGIAKSSHRPDHRTVRPQLP